MASTDYSVLGAGCLDSEDYSAETQSADVVLKSKLVELGFSPGPITRNTRDLYVRHLERLSLSPAGKDADEGNQKPASTSVKLSAPSASTSTPMTSACTSVKPSAPSSVSTSGLALDLESKLPQTDYAYDFFLSYSRQSTPSEFLQHLEEMLRGAGYSVWRDSTHIAGGSEWHSAVAKALLHSRALVCLLTDSYLHSQYCTKELFLAEHKGKLLFPVFLQEDVDLERHSGVLLTLSSLNWIKPTLPSKGGCCRDWRAVAGSVAVELRRGLLMTAPHEQTQLRQALDTLNTY